MSKFKHELQRWKRESNSEGTKRVTEKVEVYITFKDWHDNQNVPKLVAVKLHRAKTKWTG